MFPHLSDPKRGACPIYFHRHDFSGAQEENFLPVSVPSRCYSTMSRYLPFGIGPGERAHIDFISSRFIRLVCNPSHVVREPGVLFRILCLEEWHGFSITGHWENPNVTLRFWIANRMKQNEFSVG